jgi:polysaccharide biosynthesis transport protein
MTMDSGERAQMQQSPDMIDLRGIFLLLRRQIRLIILATGLVIGAALVYLVTATPMYTARTLLMVDPSQRNLLDQDGFGVSSAQTDNAKIDSEVEIIRSPATALAVIKAARLIEDQEFGPSVGFLTRMKIALGLQAETPPSQEEVLQGVIQRLNNATKVRRLGLTYLISLDVSSKSPARAASIANIMAKTYITNQVESKVRASLAARDVLQEQADAGLEAVAASDAALDKFIEENLLVLEEDAGNPRVAELRAGLEAQRAQLLAQEANLRTASSGLQERNLQALSDSLASDAVNQLLEQRAAIAAQLEQAANAPKELLDLQAELAGIDTQIDAAANDAIVSLRGDVAEQNAKLDDLRAQLRSTLLQSDLSSQSLAQIFELQQAATNARNQYQNVLTRLAEIENQAAVQVAQSRVVSEALPPSSKSTPNTRLILAMAIVLGLGMGVGIAFLNEYYIGGIVNPAQLEQVSGLQVASVVPRVHDGAQQSVAAKIAQEPLSSYSESIRRLRAVIDQDLRSKWRERQVTGASGKESRAKGHGETQPMHEGAVIMVTSSVPAEGKSNLSLSLARVYAMAGLKTIILDADLRKPTIAGLLDVEVEVGLLDFLMNADDSNLLDNVIVVDDPLTPLNCILGAGRAKVPTDQLLSSPSFGFVIEKLKANFDVVIIDTAPLLPVVDTRYVAIHADAVVMAVRWAATSQSDLRGAISMLTPVLSPQVNVYTVLSQNEQATGGYGYGYGYRYSSYYGAE